MSLLKCSAWCCRLATYYHQLQGTCSSLHNCTMAEVAEEKSGSCILTNRGVLTRFLSDNGQCQMLQWKKVKKKNPERTMCPQRKFLLIHHQAVAGICSEAGGFITFLFLTASLNGAVLINHTNAISSSEFCDALCHCRILWQ